MLSENPIDGGQESTDFGALLQGILGHTGGEYSSLLYTPTLNGPARSEVLDPRHAVVRASELADNQQALWFGANPTKGPARKWGGRGTNDDVTRIAGLCGDIDVKEGACATLDIAKAVVAELSILLGSRPTVVIQSGGGLQPIWPIADGDNLEAGRKILARWGRAVQAVADRFGIKLDNVSDAARVLRVPGSYNHKYGEPRLVAAIADIGRPLELEEIGERLDEWGIEDRDDDGLACGEPISTPDEWKWAETTCPYTAKMIAGLATDVPRGGRNPWLLSQTIRLLSAHKVGCITEADFLAAAATLERRFAEIVKDPRYGLPRSVKPLEHQDARRCALGKVVAKTDDQALKELGHHTHFTGGTADDFYGAGNTDAGIKRDTTPGCGDGNAEQEPEATTWEAIDLSTWLDGSRETPQPAVGISRTDGIKLLYPGCEHTVFGETEAGKSWLALECAAVEIRMGRDVVYIHYEESNPASTIERLQLLYCTRADIAEHLRFVAPARPVRGEWLAPLLDPPPSLVIHDGVNEAMSLHGDGINDTDGAAAFRRTVIKPFTAAGVTSLSCDHVVKNSESRGRYAIGSVHKVNAIDGAAFLMENIAPFGRGLRGASRVYVTKDRPGQLRAYGKPTEHAGKTFIGVLAVDATGDSPDFLVFYPPKADSDEDTKKANGSDADLREIVFNVLAEQPGQQVESLRKLHAALRLAGESHRDSAVKGAIDELELIGRVRAVIGKRNAMGYQVVPTAAEPCISEVAPATAAATAAPTAAPIRAAAVGSSRDQSAADRTGSSGKQWEALAENSKVGVQIHD